MFRSTHFRYIHLRRINPARLSLFISRIAYVHLFLLVVRPNVVGVPDLCTTREDIENILLYNHLVNKPYTWPFHIHDKLSIADPPSPPPPPLPPSDLLVVDVVFVVGIPHRISCRVWTPIVHTYSTAPTRTTLVPLLLVPVDYTRDIGQPPCRCRYRYRKLKGYIE